MLNPASTAKSTANLTAIGKYLSRSNVHEKQLTEKLNLNKQLLTTVQRVLPEFLALQCVACVVNQPKLNIYTTSPVWASRLHFHKVLILKRINASKLVSIDRVDIRILFPEPSRSRPAARTIAASIETVRLLTSFAQTLEQGPLKQSVSRLARSLKKRL